MECKIYLEMTVGRNDNECIFCLQTVGFLASFEVNRMKFSTCLCRGKTCFQKTNHP